MEDGRIKLWDLKKSSKLNSWILGTNVSDVRLHWHSTHIYLIGGAYHRVALTHLGDQSASCNTVHCEKIWAPMKKNLPGSVKTVAVTVVRGKEEVIGVSTGISDIYVDYLNLLARRVRIKEEPSNEQEIVSTVHSVLVREEQQTLSKMSDLNCEPKVVKTTVAQPMDQPTKFETAGSNITETVGVHFMAETKERNLITKTVLEQELPDLQVGVIFSSKVLAIDHCEQMFQAMKFDMVRTVNSESSGQVGRLF